MNSKVVDLTVKKSKMESDFDQESTMSNNPIENIVSLWKKKVLLGDREMDEYYELLIENHKSRIFFMSSLVTSQVTAPHQKESKKRYKFDEKWWDLGIFSLNEGYHWSVLIYYRHSNCFYYHDSLGSLGQSHCIKFVETLRSRNLIPEGYQIRRKSKDSTQFGEYECGYYCIVVIYCILNQNHCPCKLTKNKDDHSLYKFTPLNYSIIDNPCMIARQEKHIYPFENGSIHSDVYKIHKRIKKNEYTKLHQEKLPSSPKLNSDLI